MEISEAKKIWAEVKAELRTILPDHAFYPWVNAMETTGCEDNKFRLITVHAMAPQIIRSNYYQKFINAFKKITDKDYDFGIFYDDEFAKQYEKAKKKESSKPKSLNTSEEEQENILKENLAKMQSSNLNLKYKFENFVVGDNSEFTYALAQNVAKKPAQKYNPLFIYGASGLGKTHIMQAIGQYILFNTKLKVKYIKTEEYVNELIKSIQEVSNKNNVMETFRQKYRSVDVLLIDDIQFIESKKRTMDEIFHTFDHLLEKNKQVVITSDRLPADIPGLPARLQTRFEKGVMTEITPPDFETRVAILKKLAEQENINANFDVFEYIANSFVNNVRELEGAFNKVRAYCDIYQKELTLELAQKVLGNDVKKKEITLAKIAQDTAQYYGVTVDDFKGPSRSQRISNARQVAVYLSREITGASFEQIAEFFNKKHPTMVYSYEKVKKEAALDNPITDDIKKLKREIKG
ncbi:chromosomal replication initiator protein DnaA [bacterium]|nr:chromosomal replication initiator protein DnaA [bacterium]